MPRPHRAATKVGEGPAVQLASCSGNEPVEGHADGMIAHGVLGCPRRLRTAAVVTLLAAQPTQRLAVLADGDASVVLGLTNQHLQRRQRPLLDSFVEASLQGLGRRDSAELLDGLLRRHRGRRALGNRAAELVFFARLERSSEC